MVLILTNCAEGTLEIPEINLFLQVRAELQRDFLWKLKTGDSAGSIFYSGDGLILTESYLKALVDGMEIYLDFNNLEICEIGGVIVEGEGGFPIVAYQSNLVFSDGRISLEDRFIPKDSRALNFAKVTDMEVLALKNIHNWPRFSTPSGINFEWISGKRLFSDEELEILLISDERFPTSQEIAILI